MFPCDQCRRFIFLLFTMPIATSAAVNLSDGNSYKIIKNVSLNVFPIDPVDLGANALFEAVLTNDLTRAKAIVNCEYANVNIETAYGLSALMQAAILDHPRIAKMLLDKDDAIVNLRSPISGWTALMYAAHNSNTDLASLLINYGADTDVVDKSGKTALDLAGNTATRLVINQAQRVPRSSGTYQPWRGPSSNPLLLPAFQHQITSIVFRPLSRNTNITDPVIACVIHKAIPLMSALLANGADCNVRNAADGLTPLMLASSKGLAETISLLVKQHSAKMEQRDQNGWTALHYAAASGKVGSTRQLLALGAEANARSNIGVTPLMLATMQGDEASMSALLSSGRADVNWRDDNGATALFYAVGAGEKLALRTLLRNGALVDLRKLDGGSALVYAAKAGDASIVRLLLHAGADVNLQTNDKSTALMFATHHGNEECVRRLLSFGADRSMRNSNYLIAADFATSEPMKQILGVPTKH